MTQTFTEAQHLLNQLPQHRLGAMLIAIARECAHDADTRRAMQAQVLLAMRIRLSKGITT